MTVLSLLTGERKTTPNLIFPFPSQILRKFILDSKNNCYFLSVSSQGEKQLEGLLSLPLMA
jgi:hypothetical protein